MADAPLTQPDLFYDDRFWEQYVGRHLVSDPVTAIVELVANAWDAGAREARITWPAQVGDCLQVADDGEGMTEAEFYRRWGTLSYDRSRDQGDTVLVEEDGVKAKRRTFGRNGIGRFAAFCFGPEYTVTTRKNGQENRFLVKKGRTRPLEFTHCGTNPSTQPGTTIEVPRVGARTILAEAIRTELGRRFLTNPHFGVFVDGVRVAFEDIQDRGLERIEVAVPAIGGRVVTVKVIDAQRTDRTVRQHGVAWHVRGRLVGDCAWKDPEQRSLLDGRRVEAKRFTFIVEADLLLDAGAVLKDWSWFDEANATFGHVNTAVQRAVTGRLLEATKEKRREISSNIHASLAPQIRQLTPLRRERLTAFVEKIQEECPRLTENELKSVSGVLANMELAQSQYGLLHKLHGLTPDQIDDLHQVLDDWTVDMAKVVLDEIRTLMRLVEELRLKTADLCTQEVQELQPLFREGLWIFGPEFETIHFTSNEGMTRVIQELFHKPGTTGSRNRPDFAIVPDGTVGLYSYPEYDDQGAEVGPAKLVIVELKAPGVPITDKEKSQCYHYVRELAEKGLLTEHTQVQGFVLGRTIKQVDRGERTEMGGRVRILPLDFGTVLQRADSRLLRLHEKIKSAPFLQERGIGLFLDEGTTASGQLELGLKEVAHATSP